MTDVERYRLVILGGAGVGKSCIIRRFLLKTYTDRYRATVEDLYNREFDLGSVTIKVDILDTSGDMQFPAMRRLSIANAHAFVLVYATTSAISFASVQQCFEEIRSQRGDFQEIPIVIVGNKMDLSTHHEVQIGDVSEWLFCTLPKLRAKVVECSAKEDTNVTEIFRAVLNLSRILPANNQNTGLKRRSSAYVSATSKGRVNSPSLGATERDATMCGDGGGGLPDNNNSTKAKPRSRSLIRRSSRKTKQQIQQAPDDCNVQ